MVTAAKHSLLFAETSAFVLAVVLKVRLHQNL